ncbi:response regulator [Shewanella psychromarinicola]|uniref:Response regulator n=1 Tax=Shewanella psychromarinicola TaxID=2487742 RepID=A0A3N4DZ41_9GAMM|nr:response regulator [Shewanella psychromarinicola]AZG35455.1 response regulator [Shewanella psychromarinicola]MCL1084112.1 response regulator [Shewanella psychromarinicola]RPA31189.1 response regulator [Shewanella psychromarinicola]
MLIKNFNVLLVDDVVLMCNFLYGVTNEIQGCSAFKSLYYKTAEDILESEVIDLLITDIELKNASGIDLLSKIRCGAFSQTAHDIPILVLSVNSYKDVIQQCILFDVNDFLVKPISAVKLKNKILEHLQCEKFIQPVSYYVDLMEKLTELNVSKKGGKRSVSIVLELEEKILEINQNLDGAVSTVDNNDFLCWPEGVTTGYHQLDRRLKNLAFTISYFNNVFIDNGQLITAHTARKRACASADYLEHIVKNLQQFEDRPEFWGAFQICLYNLQTIMAEVASVNLKHNNQVLALLKKLALWWMQTCNRPLIQKADDSDDNEKR